MATQPSSEVKVVADSISGQGVRILSFQARYWRPIHSEVMTHRVFGRNARSSRAVPVITLLKEDIFIPQFGMNKKGMQSTVLPDLETQLRWEIEWQELAEKTRDYVRRWGEEGMHKQHANRPLEWFGWIDVLITSTEWANFYALRRHSAAQPELRQLADQMFAASEASTPQLLRAGQWHMPYIREFERNKYNTDDLLKLSTARCARLSYRPFDRPFGNDVDFDAEKKRHDDLVVNRPVHASPAEHQATPDYCDKGVYRRPDLHGNLHGWIQYRKTLEAEAVKDR